MAPIVWRRQLKFEGDSKKIIGPTLKARLSDGIRPKKGYFLKIFEEPLFWDNYLKVRCIFSIATANRLNQETLLLA